MMTSVRNTLGFCISSILLLGQTAASGNIGDNFLIPLQYPCDSAFDPQQRILYITQYNNTQVLRYDFGSSEWLNGMQLNPPGRGIYGVELTADGRWLYAATSISSGTTGYIGKFDLQSGLDHGFTYPMDRYEYGAFDLARTSNGKAFFTPGGSGHLREIDLSNDHVTERLDAPGSAPGGALWDHSGLFPSGDRRTMFVWQGNSSWGPGFIYDAINDSFGPCRNLYTSWVAGASVNRNGTLISTPIPNEPHVPLPIRNRSLDIVHELGPFPGAEFDPVRDRLYVLDEAAGQIIAFDTGSWTELFRFSVGESINDVRYFQEGSLRTSSDGEYLFLNTDSGIRVYTVPEPSAALSLGVCLMVLASCRRR